MNRKIDELIRVPLSKKILFDNLQDCSLMAHLINNQIEFAPTALPAVNSAGIIEINNANIT